MGRGSAAVCGACLRVRAGGTGPLAAGVARAPREVIRQTTPREDSVPIEVEDHDSLTNLRWNRLAAVPILGVIRGPWGIESNGVRPLEMDCHEERAWCTKGATEVLGLWRWWAYNVVGLLKGRYLRAARDRACTLAGFVAWLEQVSSWGEARRHVRQVVPAGEEAAPVDRGAK
jgi:hypothetical protein